MAFRYLNDKTYRKQRGFSVASENGGPLDSGSIFISLPNSEQTMSIPNLYMGRVIFVCDEDNFYIWSLKAAYDVSKKDLYVNDPYSYGEWKLWISADDSNPNFGIDFKVGSVSTYSESNPLIVTSDGNTSLTANCYALYQGKKIYFDDAQIGYEWNTNAVATSGNTYTFSMERGYDKVGFITCKAYVTISGQRIYLSKKKVKFIVLNKERTTENVTITNNTAVMHVMNNCLFMTNKTSQLQRGMAVAVRHENEETEGATNLDMSFVMSKRVYNSDGSANRSNGYWPEEGKFPNFYQGRLVYSRGNKEYYYWGRTNSNFVCYIPTNTNVSKDDYIRLFNRKNGVYDSTKFTWKVLPRLSDFDGGSQKISVKSLQLHIEVKRNSGGYTNTVTNGNLGDLASGNYTLTASLYALLSNNTTLLKVANTSYAWSDTNSNTPTRYWGLVSIAGEQAHVASTTGQEGYFDFLVNSKTPTPIVNVNVTATTTEGITFPQDIIGTIKPSVSNYGCNITIDGTNPSVYDAANFIVNPNHPSSASTKFHAALVTTASEGEQEQLDTNQLVYTWGISETSMDGPTTTNPDKYNNFLNGNPSTTNNKIVVVSCTISYPGLGTLAKGNVNVTLLRSASFDVQLSLDISPLSSSGDSYTCSELKPSNAVGTISVTPIDVFNSASEIPTCTWRWEVEQGTWNSTPNNGSATFSCNNSDQSNKITYKAKLYATFEGWGDAPVKDVTIVINKASLFDIIFDADKMRVINSISDNNVLASHIPGGDYTLEVTAALHDVNGNISDAELARNGSFSWSHTSESNVITSLSPTNTSTPTVRFSPSENGDKSFVLTCDASYGGSVVKTETVSGVVNKKSALYVKFRSGSSTGTVIDNLPYSPYYGTTHNVYAELASRNNDDLSVYTIKSIEWSGSNMNTVTPNGHSVSATCSNSSKESQKTVGLTCIMYLEKNDAGEILQEVASAEIYGKVGMAPNYRLIVKHNGTEIDSIGELYIGETYEMTAEMVDDNNVESSSVISNASFSWADSTGSVSGYVGSNHTIVNTSNSSDSVTRIVTIVCQANYSDPIVNDILSKTLVGHIRKAPKYELELYYGDSEIRSGSSLTHPTPGGGTGMTFKAKVVDLNADNNSKSVVMNHDDWEWTGESIDYVTIGTVNTNSTMSWVTPNFRNTELAKTEDEISSLTKTATVSVTATKGSWSDTKYVTVDILPTSQFLPRYTGMEFVPAYKQSSNSPDNAIISTQSDADGKFYASISGQNLQLGTEYVWFTLDDDDTRYALSSDSDNSSYGYVAETSSDIKNYEKITLHAYGFWNNSNTASTETITRYIHEVTKSCLNFSFSSPYKRNDDGTDIFIRQYSPGKDDDNDYYFDFNISNSDSNLTTDINLGNISVPTGGQLSTKHDSVGSVWQYSFDGNQSYGSISMDLGPRGLKKNSVNTLSWGNGDISGKPYLAAYDMKVEQKAAEGTITENTTCYLNDLINVYLCRTYKMITTAWKKYNDDEFKEAFTSISYSGTGVDSTNGTFKVSTSGSYIITVTINLFGKKNGSKTLTMSRDISIQVGDNVEGIYIDPFYDADINFSNGLTTDITEYAYTTEDGRVRDSRNLYMSPDMVHLHVIAVGRNLSNVEGEPLLYWKKSSTSNQLCTKRTLEELKTWHNLMTNNYSITLEDKKTDSEGRDIYTFCVHARCWASTNESNGTREYAFCWGGKWGRTVNGTYEPCEFIALSQMRTIYSISLSADSTSLSPGSSTNIYITVNGDWLTKYPNYIKVSKSTGTWTEISPTITCSNPYDPTKYDNERKFKFNTDALNETTIFRVEYKINGVRVFTDITIYIIEEAPEITIYSRHYAYMP